MSHDSCSVIVSLHVYIFLDILVVILYFDAHGQYLKLYDKENKLAIFVKFVQTLLLAGKETEMLEKSGFEVHKIIW